MKKLIAILIIIAFALCTVPAFAAGKSGTTSTATATKPSMEKRVLGFWNGVYDFFYKMKKPVVKPGTEKGATKK